MLNDNARHSVEIEGVEWTLKSLLLIVADVLADLFEERRLDVESESSKK